MAVCSNCKTKLSCSCKKRTASDGRSVCASCIKSYESKLTSTKSTTTKSGNIAPVVISATAVQKDK